MVIFLEESLIKLLGNSGNVQDLDLIKIHVFVCVSCVLASGGWGHIQIGSCALPYHMHMHA
jgi:hypothetical protein